MLPVVFGYQSCCLTIQKNTAGNIQCHIDIPHTNKKRRRLPSECWSKLISDFRCLLLVHQTIQQRMFTIHAWIWICSTCYCSLFHVPMTIDVHDQIYSINSFFSSSCCCCCCCHFLYLCSIVRKFVNFRMKSISRLFFIRVIQNQSIRNFYIRSQFSEFYRIQIEKRNHNKRAKLHLMFKLVD